MTAETKKTAKPASGAKAKTGAAGKGAGKTSGAGKTGAKIRVTQIGSPIGREQYQRDTLIGLGLNKRHRSRVLEDTAAVRGMIRSVQHLVKVEPAA